MNILAPPYNRINRHIREYATPDPRVRVYRCNTMQNPLHFVGDEGALADIDLGHRLATSTHRAGGIMLARRNIVSIGLRDADTPEKFIGLRPDDCQEGAEQMEWSLVSAEVGGRARPLDFRRRRALGPVTHDVGPLVVQHTRQRCRLMVPATPAADGFRVEFTLHLAGLRVVERPELGEWWLYSRDTGRFRFRIARPHLIDPVTLDPVTGPDGMPLPPMVRHSLTPRGDGTWRYVKEPTEAYDPRVLPVRFLVDADTVYSAWADGVVVGPVFENWTNTRSAAAGAANSDMQYSNSALTCWSSAGDCVINRCFFYYDTSAVSGTITDVVESVYSYSYGTDEISSQQGTQNTPLVDDDYNNFSGTYWGKVQFTAGARKEITYDGTGVAAINQSGVTLTCLRNYTHDYLDSAPGTYSRNGLYFANNNGTTYDPYLEITTEAAGPAMPVMYYHYAHH